MAVSPRVQVTTASGQVVGEVSVFPTNIGTRQKPRFGHGWDGQEFERLWALAIAAEERERQIDEWEE